MTKEDIETLGRYNAQVAQGLVHTDEFRERMARLQGQFNLETYGNKAQAPPSLWDRMWRLR